MELMPILSLILLSPTAVALVLVMLPREEKSLLRWTAFIGSLITLVLSLALWFEFKSSGSGFQFVEQFDWYPSLNASYHLGVDGLSLTMVLLTTLLTPIAILASFNIEDKSKAYSVKAYMILFLLLETGMLASQQAAA